MKRLTIEQIEAIRERAEKATDGPWSDTDGYRRFYVFSCNGIDDATGGAIVADCDDSADAWFIANARQDVPLLLAEIAHLNGVIGALKSDLETIEDHVEGNGLLIVQEAIKYAEENL